MLRLTYEDLNLCYPGGESTNTAMNRAIQVVKEVLCSAHANIIIVSHGGLISLLLNHYDDRFGFAEWDSMSNPDVFLLAFAEDKPCIKRIWAV
ncbi:histidine phosphatase family protein [Paenibacillus kobensis]|uniref:histidine phosphatase family protein n=1 Tax=Paenibacillus kobensis TaxID=59841 RepID=UPI000FDBFD71|nr:histidine phosphatase family protein [Paenibacillus kobensis]